jgi:hypothetical protein
VRVDHEFNQNNTVFFRFNRSNNNLTSPEGFPDYQGEKSNYSRAYAGGYTHIFSPNTWVLESELATGTPASANLPHQLDRRRIATTTRISRRSSEITPSASAACITGSTASMMAGNTP